VGSSVFTFAGTQQLNNSVALKICAVGSSETSERLSQHLANAPKHNHNSNNIHVRSRTPYSNLRFTTVRNHRSRMAVSLCKLLRFLWWPTHFRMCTVNSECFRSSTESYYNGVSVHVPVWKAAQRFAIPPAFGSWEQVAWQTACTEKYHTTV